MPFRILDETGAATNLEVADTGARIGIGGAADGTHPLAILGVVFIKTGSVLADGLCPPAATSPTVGSVTLAANTSSTVSTAASSYTAVGQDGGGYVGVQSPTTSAFTLVNNDTISHTVHYSFW